MNNIRIKIAASAILTGALLAAPVAAHATNNPVSICHSGNGTNFTYIAPDANGLNGHKNHQADVYGLTETECLAKNVTYVYEVGYYVYKKLDANLPAVWENSGQQTLVTVQPGTEWLSTPALPEWVCGEGWGYQQDKVKHDGNLIFPQNITYPNDSGMGWPPIYDAKHGELSGLPACITEPPIEYVTPLPPTFEECTATTAAKVNVPTDTPQVKYTRTDAVGTNGTLVRIIATPALSNVEFPAQTASTWQFEVTDKPCPTPTETPVPPTETPVPTQELAETGFKEDVLWPMFWVALATMVLGLVLALRKKEVN